MAIFDSPQVSIPSADELQGDTTEPQPVASADLESPATVTNLLKALMKVKDSEEPTAKPPKPIMGDIVLSYKTYEPWTGGKPKADWSGLVADAGKVPLPTQLRPVGSKAATALIKRSEGIFADAKSKFKSKGDLDYFCRSLHQFFKMHGMDTISYRKDPQDTTKMISVFTDYPCLSSTVVKSQTEWIRSCYDDYDKQNDDSARECFLNSLSDSLKKEIQTKTKPDDLFVDVFVTFVENERPLSGNLYASMEKKVLSLHISKYQGANVKAMATSTREMIQELVRARAWDSVKNTTLCRIFATASANNPEYTNPMYHLLDKVKCEVLKIINMTNVQKLEHMIEVKASHDDILNTATDLYNEQTIEGMERWPAMINSRDLKAPTALLSQIPDRENGNGRRRTNKHKDKFNRQSKGGKQGKHKGPSPSDKPAKMVNGQPVYEKKFFGRLHQWCAKCNRWTTSHSTATHVGKKDLQAQRQCEKDGTCPPATTSSGRFANQATSYLIPDPRVYLAFMHPCDPADTQ